ncbi:hypothetical protein GCM10009828_097720 [Actinoplanes couchii]|uniref:Uncharacterized protein n=2 Tax=Actinoplanes couchii TaxID=403638 RepID=A0ABQ3XQN4_9ACTN|nr:hypothetical protein Aco03nite_092070 [Actinoplanes couchii]
MESTDFDVRSPETGGANMDRANFYRGRVGAWLVNDRYLSRFGEVPVQQPRGGSWPFDLTPERGWPGQPHN